MLNYSKILLVLLMFSTSLLGQNQQENQSNFQNENEQEENNQQENQSNFQNENGQEENNQQENQSNIQNENGQEENNFQNANEQGENNFQNAGENIELEQNNNFQENNALSPADEIGNGNGGLNFNNVGQSNAVFEEDNSSVSLDGPIVQKLDRKNLFSGAPPMPGTLRNLASGEAPEVYNVEIGDTLFDICDQLLDEPGYWPKLWSMNAYILNPHFIYPGMRLRFYSGDSSSPPFLQVVTEDNVVPVDTRNLEKDELLQERMDGLLTRGEMPNRTPIVSSDEIKEFPLDEAFVNQKGAFKFDFVRVIIPAFIYEEEIEPLGIVKGGTSGSLLMDANKNLVLEEEEGLRVGTTLSVLRLTEEVEHPKTGDRVGYRYEFIAHVRVVKQFDEDDELFHGRSVFARTGIRPGDILAPFRAVKRKVSMSYRVQEKGDHHVVGLDFPSSRVAGRGNFIMLDQKNGSLEVGTAVKLFQDVRKPALSISKSDLPFFQKGVADAYIVDNAGPTAVAYLVKSNFEVRLGDRTKRTRLE